MTKADSFAQTLTLLTEIGLTLLDRRNDHVTNTGGRQTVQASVGSLDGDHVEVLGSRVVSAVHDGAHGLRAI